MPIPISGGYNNDPKNEFEKLEDKIKDLEGYLSAEILGEEYDDDPNSTGIQSLRIEGLDLSDIGAVKNEIEKSRIEELKYIEENGHPYDDTPVSSTDRLSEVRNKISVTEQRLRDLQGLMEAVAMGEPYDVDPNTLGIQTVSGLNTSQNPYGAMDMQVIKGTIEKTEAYKTFLKDAESFWEKITSAEIKSLADHSGPVTKDQMIYGVKDGIGFIGLERIIQLNGLYDALIEGNDYDADPDSTGIQNVPGLNTPQNPYGMRDANVIRGELFKATSYFEAQLEKAKNEPWFNEIKDIALKRQTELDKKMTYATDRAEKLEKLLDSLLNGTEFTDVIPGLNTPQNPNGSKDPNIVRQELYRMRALQYAIDGEQTFLDKITKPGGDDDTQIEQQILLKGDMNGDGKIDKEDSSSLEYIIKSLDQNDPNPKRGEVRKAFYSAAGDLVAALGDNKSFDNFLKDLEDAANKATNITHGSMTFKDAPLFAQNIKESIREGNSDKAVKSFNELLNYLGFGEIIPLVRGQGDFNKDGKLDNTDLQSLTHFLNADDMKNKDDLNSIKK